MKTFKLTFEDSALAAFETYAESVRMSIPEILATMSQDLVNSSSSIPVKGRDVKAEMDNYFSESLKTPTFLKLAMIHLLSSSKSNPGDTAVLVDELEKNATEMAGELLVSIRRGLATPSLPSAAAAELSEEFAVEEKMTE